MKNTILVVAILVLGILVIIFFTQSSKKSQNPPTTSTALLGKPGTYTCVKGNLVASGSTALAPLVQAIAQKYQTKCKTANITVQLGGSGTGLTNVENGSSIIGNSDIYSKQGQEDLVDHQVAVVIFSMIVNNKVNVTNLTTDQIKGIYTGQITNWTQVGGLDLPIVVVSRPTSSGTRATFQKYVLGTVETVSGPESLTTDSAGTVIKNVAQTDGAIGYVGTGPAKQAGLMTLQIDNVSPTAAAVKDNSYKFWNIEHMYTKGKAKPLAQALIDYMLSGDGKKAAQSLDYVAISDISQHILLTHQQQ